MSASKPPDEASRKLFIYYQKPIFYVVGDKYSGYLIYWLYGSRCRGGMTFIRAYWRNTGSLMSMQKGKPQAVKSETITNVI